MSWIPLGACTLPADPASVRRARRWLTRLLQDRPDRIRQATDDAVLLLSETVTNAVRYGSGPTVTLSAAQRPAALHIEVTNRAGPTVPHRLDDPDAEGGRGLPILDALARAWGYRTLLPGHLSVWFELAAEPPPSDRPCRKRPLAAPGTPTAHPRPSADHLHRDTTPAPMIRVPGRSADHV